MAEARVCRTEAEDLCAKCLARLSPSPQLKSLQPQPRQPRHLCECVCEHMHVISCIRASNMNLYVCMHACMYSRIVSTHTCACVCIYMYISVCVCMAVCVCMYICTYIYVYIYIYNSCSCCVSHSRNCILNSNREIPNPCIKRAVLALG